MVFNSHYTAVLAGVELDLPTNEHIDWRTEEGFDTAFSYEMLAKRLHAFNVGDTPAVTTNCTTSDAVLELEHRQYKNPIEVVYNEYEDLGIICAIAPGSFGYNPIMANAFRAVTNTVLKNDKHGIGLVVVDVNDELGGKRCFLAKTIVSDTRCDCDTFAFSVINTDNIAIAQAREVAKTLGIITKTEGIMFVSSFNTWC